jgi:aminoglycoside phosphotransferase (APT) family kinase protein
MINAEWLGRRLGGEVTDLQRMLGGASRETWSFRLAGRALVLRRDPPGAPRAGAMRREAALLQLAGDAGVPVPSIVAAGDDFIVMSRLAGETIARRILREDMYGAARSRLTAQCGRALARLHTGIPVESVPALPEDADPLASVRGLLDRFAEPHPALELGLRRLQVWRPAPLGRVVLHGDFRLGNLMVDADGVVGVLDWELAHVGDPAEDLGWLCVRSWRFGGASPVAGVGRREDLLEAYATAGGASTDLETLAWWEAYGTLRWGVICVQQAATHLSGAVRSVELAAIGRRVCEVELDLLDLVAPDVDGTPERESAPEIPPTHQPHDRPTAGELLEAVQEWIDGLPLAGRDAFLAKVATRALAVVGRELDLGPALAAAHAARLDALGVSDDAELAAAIRSGRDDAAVESAVRAAVVDKLRVADPRQLRNRF